MLNKTKLIDIAKTKLLEEIDNIKSIISSETESLKDSPNAMQSWSDTTRSQKEDLLFGLNNQLSIKLQMYNILRSLKIEQHTSIQISSLVQLKENGNIFYYLIIPSNIVETIKVNGHPIYFISPNSLVARSLFGFKSGNTVIIDVPAGKREIEILAVS